MPSAVAHTATAATGTRPSVVTALLQPSPSPQALTPPDTVTQLLDVWDAEGAARYRGSLRSSRWADMLLVSTLAAGGFLAFFHRTEMPTSVLAGTLVSFAAQIPLQTLRATARRLSVAEWDAILALSEKAADDPRTLAPLIRGATADAITPQQLAARQRIRCALTLRLWEIRPQNSFWINEEMRAALREWLLSPYTFCVGWKRGHGVPLYRAIPGGKDLAAEDAELQVAILKALALIGDPASALLLRRIANIIPTGPNTEFVRDAARECTALQNQQRRTNKERLAYLCKEIAVSRRDPDAGIARALNGLGAEETKNLLVAFLQTRSRLRLHRGLVTASWLLAAGVAAIPLLVLPDHPLLAGLLGIFFGSLPIATGITLAQVAAVPSRTERVAADILVDLQDVRALSAVADVMDGERHLAITGPRVDLLAGPWLDLLQRLQSGDGVWLPRRHRALLLRLVRERRRRKDWSLSTQATIAAALHALGSAGETRVLRDAGALARPEESGGDSSETVRRAARACTDRLRAIRSR